jgi:hypothetical protein
MLADPYPSPLSTQLSSLHRRFSFGSDAGSTRSSPGGSSLRSVSTGTMALFNAEAGQPSHSPPVTTDPVSGTSRPLPSTPERKRTLPDDSDSVRSHYLIHDPPCRADGRHRWGGEWLPAMIKHPLPRICTGGVVAVVTQTFLDAVLEFVSSDTQQAAANHLPQLMGGRILLHSI